MASPDFLVIPHQLILDARLQPLDRIVYGVVYWYAKMKDGQCYASNATLAQSCGPDTKPGSVQDALTRLEACGYVERVYSSPKVRKEVIPLVSMGRVSANADRGIGKCRQQVSANADQSSNSSSKTTYTTSAFEDFWKEYPKKTAKPAALKAWRKESPDLSAVLPALKRFRESDQWARGFIPNPATFINQRRWEDEVESEPSGMPLIWG